MPEKKKVSLQEAIRQQLENKKNQDGNGKVNTAPVQTKKMKSQQTKKTNNQRRRMGV